MSRGCIHLYSLTLLTHFDDLGQGLEDDELPQLPGPDDETGEKPPAAEGGAADAAGEAAAAGEGNVDEYIEATRYQPLSDVRFSCQCPLSPLTSPHLTGG